MTSMPSIRPARHEDLDQITAIYNEAGVGTAASYALEPVTLADRQAWFRRLSAEDCPVLVLTSEDEIIGYASYGTFRALAGYSYTVEHSVYIRSGHRAAGGGRMLMNALLDYARGRGVHVMVGVIDGDNVDSVTFHERLGFSVTGRLPQVGRKFGQWRDIVFVARVFDGPEPD